MARSRNAGEFVLSPENLATLRNANYLLHAAHSGSLTKCRFFVPNSAQFCAWVCVNCLMCQRFITGSH